MKLINKKDEKVILQRGYYIMYDLRARSIRISDEFGEPVNWSRSEGHRDNKQIVSYLLGNKQYFRQFIEIIGATHGLEIEKVDDSGYRYRFI